MIAVESLRKRHAERVILDGLSFAIEAGEVVAIIGPSGSGKSTLLRCLNGLEPFDAGSLTIAGEELHPGARGNTRARTRLRQRVGLVFQQYHLFPHRTALANVAEGPLVVKQAPLADARARARALLDSVGLAHRAGAYPHELSGGEQQRVAIARALAMDPAVLLLDEPTSALDPQRTETIRRTLQRLAADGLTMLIATHEMRFAREVATRVLVLDEGRVIEDGSPSQVLERPAHDRTRALLGRLAAGDPDGEPGAHR